MYPSIRLPDLGWALGDGYEHGYDSRWDAAEAEALYELLEREVIPEFYYRNEKEIAKAWVARMRQSMARLTPHFSASRTVRDYTEQYYVPAASNYLQRAADNGAFGAHFTKWKQALHEEWPSLRFGEVTMETRGNQHLFTVQVYLHDLNPDAVRVELYANGSNNDAAVRQEMKRVGPLEGKLTGYAYIGSVPATRPVADYTPRIIPSGSAIAVPLEEEQILWQR
jgi:starch phosphorylase